MDFHEQLQALQARLAQVKAELLQHQSRLDDSGGIVENILTSLQELKQLMDEAKAINIAEVSAMLDSAIELQLSFLRQPVVLTEHLAAQLGDGSTEEQFLLAVDLISDLAKRLSDRLNDFEKALEHVQSLNTLLSVVERRFERAQENHLADVIAWVDRKASFLSELVDGSLPPDVIKMMAELEAENTEGNAYALPHASLNIFQRVFDSAETEFSSVFEKALYRAHGPRWKGMRFRDQSEDDTLTYLVDINRGQESRIRRGMRWIFLLMGVRADEVEWPDLFGDPSTLDALIVATGYMDLERRQRMSDALTAWGVLISEQEG